MSFTAYLENLERFSKYAVSFDKLFRVWYNAIAK